MSARRHEMFEIFAEALAQVFESMAETRPAVECEDAGFPSGEEEVLWWEQPLQIGPEMKIWAGAPRTTWEYAGTLTLNAAGLESVEASESRNTWVEILGQALSATARAIGAKLGREVACEGGAESTPDSGVEHWTAVRLTFGEKELAPVHIAFSPPLAHLLSSATAAAREADRSAANEAGWRESLPARSRTMDLLLDVDLPVSVSFGKTQLAMRDVIKLTTGSIVELHRGVSDPVDVLVNGSLVARGEVVVVEGNYGVRILEIASRSDRMRSLR